MRQLFYLSTEKLRDFHPRPRNGLTGRVSEIEASVPILGSVRVALDPGSVGDVAAAAHLDDVITHLQRTGSAHSGRPSSCADLMAWDWLEFTGRFLYGPRLRDLGLLDRGVYTFMSLRTHECRFEQGETECPDIELVLCGSRQHVVMHHDCPATRMGSGSDWLHDLAADLAASASRDDSSVALALSSTSLGDQEFAARSAYSMMADYCDGPAYLQGHARVLCNFPPDRFRHRMIVATPLYAEAGQSLSARAEPQSGPSSPTWRRWLRRPADRQHGRM
ncbi:SAVMC3_10250 family protein [Streptomyces sp. Cmuel-A718b]|uniref:SAVMC3_10250 family protein n=1 Tax=Streptomyces sp. Cmuel-A718b TaxID=697328 RepID=UPI00081E51D4|nr:SAVMC3_10250 family protein [Streptomyces sp. Cmuel-A718b]SCF59725.1 hypothetical protein GA0115280_102817 [Streptomyces sp. Cmuel-A718b]